MALFDNIDDEEDIFAPPPKPSRKPQKNIFDDLDESEDFLEKVSDSTHKSNTHEETPELFHEVQQGSSPGKDTGDLFKFQENEESTEPPPMEEDQRAQKKTDMFGDPLEDIEDTTELEIEESFEVIDTKNVPSAEDAEKELEAIEREQARLKAEEEKRGLEEGESEEEIDGGGFSKAVKHEPESMEGDEPPPLPTSDIPTSDVPTSDVPTDDDKLADDEPTDYKPADDELISNELPSDTSADEKVMQAEKALLEAVDEIEALTMKLKQAQDEAETLASQVELFREKWTTERERVESLEAQLKEKDREIAALKEASTTKPSRPSLTKRPSSTSVTSGSKPATKPATSKPLAAKPTPSSSKPPVPKTSVTSSPKMSAKLRSDESRRGQPSVAEAVKKFGGSQEVPKKPSPNTRRVSKGTEPTDKAATQQKPSSSSRTTTKSRKDSSSSEKKEEKKAASPPKPPRTRKQQTSIEEPEEVPASSMNGTTTNALDAIKMWENKTAGTADGSVTTKKSLSVQKSLPVVSKLDEERSAKESSVEKEEVNGTDDKPVVDDKENKEEAGDSASTTQSHSVSSITRSFKSQSLIERGTRTSPSTGKRGFTPAVIEKCHACNKTVYTVERLKADDKIYHKNCFKCSYCKKVVGTGTYAANKGEIFCKTHFKMLFKIKGNYDEGFGREQHKKKWGGSSTQAEEQAAE